MSESKKNRAVEVIRDEKNPEIPTTQTKAEFTALMAAYARRNPVKYALKEAALKAKLATL